MPLEITLSLDKTDLLLGENANCALSFKNTGDTPVIIANPDGGGAPDFRLIETRTGLELVMRSKPISAMGAHPLPIAPGQTHQSSVPLLRDVRWPSPGSYAVAALCEWDGGKGKAESAPVKVNVRGLGTRNLHIDSVGGISLGAVSINPAGDPPDVVLTRIRIDTGGGIESVDSIGKAHLGARPVLSLPPAKRAGNGDWVAWMELPRTLHFIHWLPDETSPAPGKFSLPSSGGEIIAPIYVQPAARGVERSAGGVLLWTEGANGGSVQVIQLQAAGKAATAKAGPSVALPGPRPNWMMNDFRSSGAKRLSFLRSAGGKVMLSAMPWPDEVLVTETKSVYEWPGEFVAAGATLGLDDALRGAILLWTGPEDNRELTLAGWTLDDSGACREHYRETLPWSATTPIADVSVRMRATGLPAVLLRRKEGEWQLYDGFGHLVALPVPYSRTQLPLELAFFGGREIALIAAELAGGLSVKLANGAGLPLRVK